MKSDEGHLAVPLEHAALVPCPHCGAAHDDDRDGPVLLANEQLWRYVFCNSCGASGPECPTASAAIAAWNRRAEREATDLMRRAMLALKQSWRALPDSHEILASYCDDLYSEIQRRLGRDGEHCMCAACKDGRLHASCCAVHNEPAMPNGPCACDYNALATLAERNAASNLSAKE